MIDEERAAVDEQDQDVAVDAGTEELQEEGRLDVVDEAGEEVGGARLIVKRANAETDEIFPVHPPAVIGRFDPSVGPVDVDLGDIPEGSYVSRKHAKITQEDGVWRIADLGSSNGTFLLRDDFERVEEAEIVDGAEIALGNARFVFRVG